MTKKALFVARRKQRELLMTLIRKLESTVAQQSELINRGRTDNFDLERRLKALVSGRVEYNFQYEEVRCEWRVSKLALRTCRDRDAIWHEVFRQLQDALMKVKI